MTPVPVSNASDVTLGVGGMHTMLLSFLPDVFECVAPMDHYPGHLMSKHSLAASVLHNGKRIVLDEHDLGPGLQHLPTNDVWRMLKSNRKVSFAASKVVACGKPVALVNLNRPLMACGDPVSVPCGFNVSNSSHSLFIGASAEDDLRGMLTNMFSMVVDVVAYVMGAFGPVSSPFGASDLAKDAAGFDPKKLVGGALSSVVVSTIMSYRSGWKEPLAVKLETGGSVTSGQTEISYDLNTKKTSVKSRGNVLGARQDYDSGAQEGKKHTTTLWGEPL